MTVLAGLAALVVGLTLGLLGGGGSVLAVPALVGLLEVPAREAIATSLVVVGTTAAAGAVPHALAGHVRWSVVVPFSASAMVGAWLGGWASAWFAADTLLLLFAAMMAATGVAMLRGRKEVRPGSSPRPALILLEGGVVGAVTGLVGAGGGFLVVPALVLLGGLSMKEAIGTSLVVIALKSAAGFAGHAQHVSVDFGLAGWFAAVAVVGSIIGSRLAQRVGAASLRKAFAVLVLSMAAWLAHHAWPEALTHALFVRPWPFWAGGAVIGALVVAFAAVAQRRFGVSTGYQDAAALMAGKGRTTWRLSFLGGLVVGGFVAAMLGGSWTGTWTMGSFDERITHNLVAKLVFFVGGGVLLGFGARLAGGCTSGHGIVGVAQRAPSSWLATATFLVAGALVANLVFGGTP
jgi:uncharacterized protein